MLLIYKMKIMSVVIAMKRDSMIKKIKIDVLMKFMIKIPSF